MRCKYLKLISGDWVEFWGEMVALPSISECTNGELFEEEIDYWFNIRRCENCPYFTEDGYSEEFYDW